MYNASQKNWPRKPEDDEKINRLLGLMELQQLEVEERKRVKLEKKRLEEEKQKHEEARLREEAERKRLEELLDARAAQALKKQMQQFEERVNWQVQSTIDERLPMVAEKDVQISSSMLSKQLQQIEERIKQQVQHTLETQLPFSAEKGAGMSDGLHRYVNQSADREVGRKGGSANLGLRRKLILEEVECDPVESGEAATTPVTKKRSASTRTPRIPEKTDTDKKKGAVASCSKDGVIDFVLELRQNLDAKKVPELKRMCKSRSIKLVVKDQAVKDLVAYEMRVADEGWLDGADSSSSKKEGGLSEVDAAPRTK
ncbi:hypothetical protein CBR_g30143 [Chara braunii]|uniref:Uncharacterized protein n=1 Tax=Chara braunii TaxID=69332 RepID=A0A388LC23_CHABU|nr:hypothetical protein CBR_g30143 [Chara braunii]|eukprot:GBG79877.1 hypothetical protein CBR_g30143 [Chara braunii]